MKDSFQIFLLVLLISIGGCRATGTVPTNPGAADPDKPSAAGGLESERTMANDEDRVSGVIELPVTMLAPAITDLAAQLGVDEQEIEVLRAIPVIWNDGSMGCPRQDMAYTQVLVPGYWVVLGHAGKRYSYHAGRSGRLRLCKELQPEPTGPPPHGRYHDAS